VFFEANATTKIYGVASPPLRTPVEIELIL